MTTSTPPYRVRLPDSPTAYRHTLGAALALGRTRINRWGKAWAAIDIRDDDGNWTRVERFKAST